MELDEYLLYILHMKKTKKNNYRLQMQLIESTAN